MCFAFLVDGASDPAFLPGRPVSVISFLIPLAEAAAGEEGSFPVYCEARPGFVSKQNSMESDDIYWLLSVHTLATLQTLNLLYLLVSLVLQLTDCI